MPFALETIDRMLEKFPNADVVFVEGGGDKLAGGEKIPRKGAPGIAKSDLLVINKTDLAPHVGADLAVMEADTIRMRTTPQGLKPFVMTNLKTRGGSPSLLGLGLSSGSRMLLINIAQRPVQTAHNCDAATGKPSTQLGPKKLESVAEATGAKRCNTTKQR